MTNQDFSTWLRVELAKANLKQVEIAKCAGISPNTIHKLYQGRRGPSVLILSYICRALAEKTGQAEKDLLYAAICSYMAAQ